METVLPDAGRQGRSRALAINASGEIVGASITATGEDPVLWPSPTKFTVLGKGVSGKPSAALAINGNGESVGYVKTSNGYDAILWHPKGAATLLGDPGHQHFAKALALNDSGHSAGYACTNCYSWELHRRRGGAVDGGEGDAASGRCGRRG